MDMNEVGRGSWLQTFTGKQFFPMDPRPEDICIEDIAHALAFSSRFNGHAKEFYSIAQHCWFVSKLVPLEDALWGLLHDASEAYVGDLIQPIKRYFPQYTLMEKEVEKVLAVKFNLPWPMPPSVKRADLELLSTEARDLLNHPPPANWNVGVAPRGDLHIFPLEPRIAEALFMDRYLELTVPLTA